MAQASTSLQDEDLCSMQVALLLSQALQEPSEQAMQDYLQETLNLHTAADWCYSVKHPCRYLVALSDSGLELEAGCKTKLSLPLCKTMYLCFGSYVPGGLEQHVPPLCHSYSCLQAVQCPEITDGSQMHGLANRVAELLPLQRIFGYLGQGYQVVLCGIGFGGLVAHATAVRILAQLRHEIATAMKLGINLSALEQTQEKVTSFAFNGPLFGNATLSDELSRHGVQGRLHTIWKAKDASPLFFTLCSELASQADSEQPSSNVLPTATCMPFSLDTRQLQLANKCASVLHTALLATDRSKANRQFACTPLQLHTLDSNTASPQGSALDLLSLQLQVPASPSSPKAGGASPKTSNTAAIRSQLSPGKGSPAFRKQLTTGTLASPGKSSTATAAGALEMPLPKTSSTPSLAPLNLKSNAAVAAAGSPRSPGPAKPRTTLPGTSVKSIDTKPAAASGTAAPGLDSQPLQALLAACNGSKLQRLAPIGRYWLLDQVVAASSKAAGGDKAASGKARKSSVDMQVRLDSVTGQQLVAAACSWLTAPGPELLAHWEWSLQELQRDFMEAFAWVTFRPVVSASGQTVPRKHTIRLNQSLLLT